MRVSTLPRNRTISTSGRSRQSCAERRGDEVPTRAFAGSAATLSAPISRSRTSARGRDAIEFARPQRLAAGVGERAILDAVAAGAHRHDLDGVRLPAVRGAQGGGGHPRLDERERRAAAAEAKGKVHGGET